MLIMFRVRNFASFKDEVILDMRAVTYKEKKSHVIDTERNKIVKTLAMFGKNASGKSNMISALYFFESFILNQFFKDGHNADDDAGRMPNIRRTSFKLTKDVDPTSEYELIFNYKNSTFQYGFMLEDTNSEDSLVREEWLKVGDTDIYDRQGALIQFGKKYRKELSKLDKVRDDRLYLATLDYFADGMVKGIVDDIKNYFRYHFNVYFELILESSVKGLRLLASYSERLFKDTDYKRTVERFVKSADTGITRLEIIERKEVDGEKRLKYIIKTVHNVYDADGNIVGEELFDLGMESSGTIRYFSFIQNVLNMLERGGVFIVDELSARLHPILTKFIIDLFQSSRNKKAQLIFTTHDISLMNRDQLRRDEIALVDKNEKGESSLYTLADIKTRTDASFSKSYLNGRYGAIPVIDEDSIDIEALEEWYGKIS